MRKFKVLFYLAVGVILCLLLHDTYQFFTNKSQTEKFLAASKILLPFEIPDTGITIYDINIEDDCMVYSLSLNKESFDNLDLDKEATPSEHRLAMIVSSLGDGAKIFVDNQLSVRYNYYFEETGEIAKAIEIAPAQIEEISKKLSTGEIQVFSFLETCRRILKQQHYPVQMEEGIWMQNAYVDKSCVHIVSKIDEIRNPDSVSVEQLYNMKKHCIDVLKGQNMIDIQKKSFLNEDVHFVYILTDKRDKEYASISIGYHDLFPETTGESQSPQ